MKHTLNQTSQGFWILDDRNKTQKRLVHSTKKNQNIDEQSYHSRRLINIHVVVTSVGNHQIV